MSRNQNLYKEPLSQSDRPVESYTPTALDSQPVNFQEKNYSLANLITGFRILLVPFVVYSLLTQQWTMAFVGFFVAALSDALDGLLARTLSLRTRLGAILDPLADKCLLMSIFAVFAYIGEVPLWLASAIIVRDFLIIGATGWVIWKKVVIPIRPAFVSKMNTLFEISLACLILCRLCGWAELSLLEESFYAIVMVTLLLSSLHYLRTAIHHYKLR